MDAPIELENEESTAVETTENQMKDIEDGSVISVKQFLDAWDPETVALAHIDPSKTSLEQIAERAGISVDLAEELANVCG